MGEGRNAHSGWMHQNQVIETQHTMQLMKKCS